MITTKVFGKTKEGQEVLAFTFTDGEKSATVLNYGGTLQSVIVPDKNGKPTDVILGYEDVQSYESKGGYLGALIGRFGNRIDKGNLVVDGKQYQLYCNNGENHLHGGKVGFDKKIWAHEIKGDELVLTLVSPDGEENFPGTLTVQVTYTFAGGALKIHYRATTDKKTVCNLTNHAYFNLNGAGVGNTCNHLLWINGEYITPTDEGLIPRGGFRAVKGTPFDFTTPKTLGQDIDADDEDIKKGYGYDHCYLLNNKCGEYALYATAIGDVSGIKMNCYTDMPALQFYAGNGMNGEGKGGKYPNHAGFCWETQAIPNNVNVPEYAAKGSSYLDVGEVYDFTAVYEFTL